MEIAGHLSTCLIVMEFLMANRMDIISTHPAAIHRCKTEILSANQNKFI